MTTHNVATLISDSGITQYKIVAPVWYVFDEADPPFWNFPQGLYLEKYDPRFRVVATVAADSARYYKLSRLWELTGNVEMTKVPGALFQSQRFFWDQQLHKIYSDTFIHIENPTHVLEGTGFESNENLTVYRILKPTGIFPVNRDNLRGATPPAPVPASGAAVPPPRPAPQPRLSDSASSPAASAVNP